MVDIQEISDARVVVTGGAGFIGSHLCDRLVANRCDVIVIDNLATGKSENIEHLFADGLSLVQQDICNFDAIRPSFHDVDYVFHMATANVRRSLYNPTLVHDTNTTGTLNVLKAAAAAGVHGFLYCSSSEIYGTAISVPQPENTWFDPTTIYGASKLTGEYYTNVFHRSGWLSCVVARPHNNYGPREHYEGINGELIPRFILLALAGRPLPVFGNGQQTRDFTYVEETAQLLSALLAHPHCRGETVSVCRGQEVSVRQIAEKVLDLTDSASNIETRPPRPNDVERLYGDHRKLRELLGTAPEIDIDVGLVRTLAWFREHIALDKATLDGLSGDNWRTPERESWIPG